MTRAHGGLVNIALSVDERIEAIEDGERVVSTPILQE
jgi:hypothetical protein